jgi:hypothetical protein
VKVTSKILAIVFASVLVLPVFLTQKVYADGLFQENLPPASIGDRQASLFVKINPPILTSDTKQDAFLQFRLFDAKTDENIKFTTFIIEVTKGTDMDAEPVLKRDAYLAEDGILTLKIQPADGPVRVFATREDFLQAWKADPGGTINIQGPVLQEGGLYHFRIELLTVDNIRKLFNPEDAPVFDTYLSVGDVFSETVQHEGQNYDTTIISYYDKVQDFNFEGQSKTYSWSMPFDWNIERINSAPNIFVHEEIKIPKSFTGVGDISTFDATVNDMSITGGKIAVDPFASETEIIVHFLLNKKDILGMANNVQPGTSEMTFTLAPASDGEEKTSTEIATDTGGIHVLMNWQPSQLEAGTESTLELTFIDVLNDNIKLDQDVKYDLRMLDNDGNEVYTKTDLVAKTGSDVQTMTFPENKTYRTEIIVKELIREGQAPDTTRSGIARGIVVVPEFPAGIVIALAGIFGAIVVAQRMMRKQ